MWAPDRHRVDVAVCDRPLRPRVTAADRDVVLDLRPLRRDAAGCWNGRFDDLEPGALYKFRLDGCDDALFADPASRYQPFGVHGPSAVIDAGAYCWNDHAWASPHFDRLVIYELHVGTFSPEGTFQGVRRRLGYLADLGVSALELMPVAAFAGERNWGYDGVALNAPAPCYGTPDDLRELVDAAHAHGLAVFLDVVYNHFGPDGAYASEVSPYYFTDAHESPWGRGVNLDGPHAAQVRRFFIENALHWVNEYHVDGLRLDATHALVDNSPRHFLEELTSTVRAHSVRPVSFIAEDHRNLDTLLLPAKAGGYGIDGVWADDFHHQVRVHTAGDREGYYEDFTGSANDIAETLQQGWFFTGQPSRYLGHARGTDPSPLDPSQFVICIQNHDQVGNRADGARLNHEIDPAVYRAVSTLLLLAPQTPLLFMGQEWGAGSPFLFFTDFHGELGRQVTEGRRQEFSSFTAFADPAARSAIPDPQSLDTFVKSSIDWTEPTQPAHAGIRRLYSRLLRTRADLVAPEQRARGSYAVESLGDHSIAVNYQRGRMVVITNFGGAGTELRYASTKPLTVCLTTEDSEFTDSSEPVLVESAAEGVHALFRRPGAIVLIGHDDRDGTEEQEGDHPRYHRSR